MLKLINIVGARPNFMKIAPVMKALQGSDKIQTLLLHTGQHYDNNMSKQFFEEFNLPEPDIYLGVGSDNHAKQTAKIIDKFDDVCESEKPDAILVVGDVNSTMACSITAVKRGIKIIHLEAGLRSFDRTMPEEINRLITDALSDLLLIPSPDAMENLLKEGISQDKIKFVGNIMIDTLYQFMPLAEKSDILKKLNVQKKDYCLVTLHRPSNVDVKENIESILKTFAIISKDVKIIFPVHPRTKVRFEQFGLKGLIQENKNLIITEPLGYLDFQKLTANSKFVITDSGGIQEETTVLKIPCLTLRENTERPITITEGTNELIGFDMERLLFYSQKAIEGNWKNSKIPELWDGNTAKRVVKEIEMIDL